MTPLSDLFALIRDYPHRHVPTDAMFRFIEKVARQETDKLFSTPDPLPRDFGPYRSLTLPFHSMGNITSLDLFGMNELVIFAYYEANRHRYKHAVDFGANIGLHSILMAILGWDVTALEPDPDTFARLRQNLEWNDVDVMPMRAAVSHRSGTAEFTRVKGNLTGSHLSGAKAEPYGDLERFPVTIIDATAYLEVADIAKIDIEGHEAELICNLPPDIWKTTDAFVEVGTRENATRIFDHLSGTVSLFSQKIGWRKAERADDLPKHHSDGSLFITAKGRMEW